MKPHGMLVVLSGLPGVGKTTIARELAHRICALHLRIDTIEQAIRDSRVIEDPMNDAGYRVAYAIALDNLRLGRTVIADSVNPIPATRDAWLNVAARAKVPALEVEVQASDGSEHKRRVQQRISDIAGLRLPTWNDVTAREYAPWDRVRLVVDSSLASVDECVETIQRALESPAAPS